MKKTLISPAVIKRLPRYYRYLEDLELKCIKNISSQKIAQQLDTTASQVRQDFCTFGAFGQQGKGYDVEYLKQELAEILGLTKTYNMIIVGAGNMGQALARYKGFRRDGFNVNALFDEKEVKMKIDLPLYSMDYLNSYVKDNVVDIAVIATSMDGAQEVADKLIAAGIKNIWNFATVDIQVPAGVTVENIFMSDSLYVLSYRMSEKLKD